MRVGEPDEVAKAAVFLASHDFSVATGIELFVDGGRAQFDQGKRCLLWRMAMRAIEAETFSGYGGLRQIELPKPQPTKDRVLVRVTAAGVTPLDHTILSGDTLGPRNRLCSATKAPVSSRMPAVPVSRSEAASCSRGHTALPSLAPGKTGCW